MKKKPLIPRKQPSVKPRPKAYDYLLFTNQPYLLNHLSKKPTSDRIKVLVELQNTIKRLYDAEIDQFDLYNAVKELITTRGATQDTIRMKVTDPLRDSIDYVDNPSRLKDKLRDMFPRIHRVNDLAEILNIHPSNLSTFLNKIQMGKSSVIGEGFDYAMAFHFKTEMNREKIFEFLNRPRKRKKSSHKSSIDKKKTT